MSKIKKHLDEIPPEEEYEYKLPTYHKDIHKGLPVYLDGNKLDYFDAKKLKLDKIPSTYVDSAPGLLYSTDTIYTDNNGGYYYEDWNKKLTPLTGRRKGGLLPKRDYISNRLEAIHRVPNLMKKVDSISKLDSINRNNVIKRLLHEGLADNWMKEYNDGIFTSSQADYFSDDLYNEPIDGFNKLGLDDFSSLVKAGKIKLPDDLKYEEVEHTNEKGRKVYSAKFDNLDDALRAESLMIKYIQDEMKKKGYPKDNVDLSTAVNAAYNLGLYHKDLDSTNFINKNYKVPNYYKLGGSTRRSLKDGGIYIKPSHRGRFTALKERTGHSSTWFKENGTPAQKKMATFALNAAKWKH